MDAAKLKTDEEYTLGAEDRVFRCGNFWYWQCRGCGDANGIFFSRDEAEFDYENWGDLSPAEDRETD